MTDQLESVPVTNAHRTMLFCVLVSLTGSACLAAPSVKLDIKSIDASNNGLWWEFTAEVTAKGYNKAASLHVYVEYRNEGGQYQVAGPGFDHKDGLVVNGRPATEAEEHGVNAVSRVVWKTPELLNASQKGKPFTVKFTVNPHEGPVEYRIWADLSWNTNPDAEAHERDFKSVVDIWGPHPWPKSPRDTPATRERSARTPGYNMNFGSKALGGGGGTGGTTSGGTAGGGTAGGGTAVGGTTSGGVGGGGTTSGGTGATGGGTTGGTTGGGTGATGGAASAGGGVSGGASSGGGVSGGGTAGGTTGAGTGATGGANAGGNVSGGTSSGGGVSGGGSTGGNIGGGANVGGNVSAGAGVGGFTGPKPPKPQPPTPPLPDPPKDTRLRVYIDAQLLRTSAPPTLINGRVMVGLADIFRALGASLTWEGSQKKITAVRGSRTVMLWIGRKTALINNAPVQLDVPPLILAGGNTYVPVRFVSQALGAAVQWSQATRSVLISTASMPPISGAPTPPYQPPPPAQGTVPISICRETGLRAVTPCKNTVTQRFAPASVPGPCTTHTSGKKLVVTEPKPNDLVPTKFTIAGSCVPGRNVRVTVVAEAKLKATGQNATSTILQDAEASVGKDGKWSIQCDTGAICRDSRVEVSRYKVTVYMRMNRKIVEQIDMYVVQ